MATATSRLSNYRHVKLDMKAPSVRILFFIFVATLSSASDTLKTDLAALTDIKKKLGSGTEFLNTWNEPSELCTGWNGVTCSMVGNEERVTLLKLVNGGNISSGLTGPFPESIFNLSALKVLVIVNHGISGSLPSSVSKLKFLHTLIIQSTPLSGQIPSTLGELGNLSSLDLMGNNFSGLLPPELGKAVNLQSIHLGSNKIQGEIPIEFGELLNLTSLRIRNNKLSGEIPLNLSSCPLTTLDLAGNELSGNLGLALFEGWCPELTFLDLSNNGLSGNLPRSLAKCSNLSAIILSNNKFVGPLQDNFYSLESLERLYLDNNSFSGSIPQSLAELAFLKELELSENKLSNQIPKIFSCSNRKPENSLRIFSAANNNLSGGLPLGLYNCTGLRTLRLQGNSLSGPFPETLANIPSLVTLELQDNGGLFGSLPWIFDTWPNLEVLNLAGNQIRGNLKFWKKNPLEPNFKILELNLSRNVLTGGVPSGVGLLTNLTSLDLGGNSLTGTVPESILKLTKLTVLDLGVNKLSGDLPVFFTSLTGVDHLDLGSNAFTGNIPIGFGGLELTYLDLSDNKLDGIVPVFQSRLTYLNLSSNNLVGPVPELPLTLTTFDFSENSLNQQVPLTLTSLINLEYLDLSGIGLLGPVANVFQDLKYIRYLNLSFNGLSGPIPSYFSNLSRFESLDLSSNIFTGQIPDGLSNLQNLTFLDLSHNELEGPIPAGKLGTFAPSTYDDNKGLCGAPLGNSCSDPQGSGGVSGPNPPQSPPPPEASNGNGNRKVDMGRNSGGNLLVGVVVLILLGVLALLFAYYFHERRRRNMASWMDRKENQRLIFQDSPHGTASSEGRVLEFSRFRYSEKGLMMFRTFEFTVSINSLAEAAGFFVETRAMEGQQGSSGACFRASLPDNQTEVIIKKLPRGASKADLEVHSQLVRIGSIQSQGVLPLLGAYVDDRKAEVFLIFPYVVGGTLDFALRNHNLSWSWPHRYGAILSLAKSLSFLHRDSVPRFVVRNLKASNVLLGREPGQVFLTDWCLSKVVDVDESNSRSKPFKYGSPEYSAPELTKTGNASTKSDVFAFGVILLQLLSGKSSSDLKFIEGGIGKWAQSSPLDEVIDPRMEWRGEHYSQVLASLKLGLMCTHTEANSRPPMDKAVQVLEDLQEFAPKLPKRAELQ